MYSLTQHVPWLSMSFQTGMNLVSQHDKQDMVHSAIAGLRRGAGNDWFSSDIADTHYCWEGPGGVTDCAPHTEVGRQKTRDGKTG